ncbi:MAG: GLUG motif-containing protein, partial [Ruminiclostridium sp.]
MNKKITQLRWLAATLMLVAAMVMPSTAWAEGYDKNGFGSESDPYQPAILTTDKYDIDGDGNKDEVYEIGNAGQLYWFADKVNNDNTNFGSANAVLTDNITVNSELLEKLNLDGTAKEGYDVRSWTPIGGSYNSVKAVYYTGIFDGNNHKIRGLYYKEEIQADTYETDDAGLFGDNKGVIKNVGVIESYFKMNFLGDYIYYVGGVCGCNTGGVIENCNFTGTVIVTGTIRVSDTYARVAAGGVCGHNTGKIKGCINAGKVTSTVVETGASYCYAGGVCGRNYNTGTIESCSNTGEVSGTDNVGGVCGSNCTKESSPKIESCSNTGNVSGTNIVGGVCGKNAVEYGNYTVTITNCYNTGEVTGTGWGVGGVSGCNAGVEGGEPSIVSNCYNTGAVSGKSYVGGVTGTYYYDTSVYITNSYNTGVVKGTSQVGGVIGDFNYTGLNVTNCYYLEGCNAEGTTFNCTEGTSKTADEFGNGSVCYLLNGGTTDGSQVWYQLLETETYPNLDSTNSANRTVYASAPCPSNFSNTNNLATVEHIFKLDDNDSKKHICATCGLSEEHHSAYAVNSQTTGTSSIKVTCGDCGEELGTITLSAPTENLTYDG